MLRHTRFHVPKTIGLYIVILSSAEENALSKKIYCAMDRSQSENLKNALRDQFGGAVYAYLIKSYIASSKKELKCFI